ncbi:MAG TPA: hypothetical protein VMW06_07625 [Desulfobacterales bacterium]|nr:hypothetical protein [Desulfobacterales bacterium]
MSFLKNKKFQASAAVISVIVLILIVVLVKYCTQREMYEPRSETKEPEGITFFDLGENSEFSNDVREKLKDRLGADAIERWNTLDLSINYNGFLRNFFPELHEINEKLNSPLGERVEHNTLKLRYRYARKRNVPFDYVELVFSNYTQKPLYFYIKSKQEGSNIIDVVTKKYGTAKTVQWVGEKGTSLYWENARSILIISIHDDRYGNPEYHTMIYYVPNLEELLSREQRKSAHTEEEIKKTGKTAF